MKLTTCGKLLVVAAVSIISGICTALAYLANDDRVSAVIAIVILAVAVPLWIWSIYYIDKSLSD